MAPTFEHFVQFPFPSLYFPLYLCPFPFSLPFPYIYSYSPGTARGSGGVFKLPIGFVRNPAAKRHLLRLWLIKVLRVKKILVHVFHVPTKLWKPSGSRL